MADIKRDFGRRLRAVRLACGYETARAFAADLGIAEDRYSLYELGKRRMPEDVLDRVKRLTGATADYLYFGDVAGLPVGLHAKLPPNRSFF